MIGRFINSPLTTKIEIQAAFASSSGAKLQDPHATRSGGNCAWRFKVVTKKRERNAARKIHLPAVAGSGIFGQPNDKFVTHVQGDRLAAVFGGYVYESHGFNSILECGLKLDSAVVFSPCP